MLIYESERSINNNYVYNQFDTNLNFNIHLHSSYEFVYVFEGTLRLTIEDKQYDVNAGEAVLILPNLIHSYETPVYSKSFLCVFSVSFAYSFYLKSKDKLAVNPVFKFDAPQEIDEILVKSSDEYLLKSFFYKVIYLFNKGNTYTEIKNKNASIVRDVIFYAEKNFDKKVSLEDLAKDLSYHYNYLSNIINSTLKMNFSTLINTQRINRAVYLIKNTNKSFTEISIDVGYSSIRSFNRNFKEFTQKSPSDFRTDLNA